MSGSDLLEVAEAVIATARAMNARGINKGTSGNVSARAPATAGDGMVITPSGRPYDELEPADLIHLSPDTSWRRVRMKVAISAKRGTSAGFTGWKSSLSLMVSLSPPWPPWPSWRRCLAPRSACRR